MPSHFALAPVAMMSASAAYSAPESVLTWKGRRCDVHRGDDVVDDLGADVLGLLEHLLHHPRTLHRIGIARIVLDIGGDHQLAALLEPGDQHRLQHGARGIDGGGIAGRA